MAVSTLGSMETAEALLALPLKERLRTLTLAITLTLTKTLDRFGFAPGTICLCERNQYAGATF